MRRLPLVLLLSAAFLAPAIFPDTAAPDPPARPEGYDTVDQIESLDTPWPDSLTPADLQGKRTFRLAVIPIEFPDRAHDPLHTTAHLTRLFFSRHEYVEAPNGDPVHGSVADYYRAWSHGAFTLTGRVFDWIGIETTAADLLERPMVNTRGQYREKALEALRAREGGDALDDYDGICFIGAGDAGRRGRGLWPHRGKIERFTYMQLTERYRDDKLLRVAIPCHELGHFFGFKDKYGLRNSRRGPGPWCLMALGTHGGAPSGRDRPFPFCAWCRTHIGWTKPVTIDPRTPRKIVLRPVDHGPGEALRVLLAEDGSEYFLLEVRRKTGALADMPDEGLFIWHVGERRRAEGYPVREYDVVLEPPHGRTLVDAGSRYPGYVAWPKPGQHAFTPRSVPSSRSRGPRALPVWIRGMARQPDGAIAFEIGPPADAPTHDDARPATVVKRIQPLLIAAEGAVLPAVESDRALRREIPRLLYSQGEYFSARRSLAGEEVRGSLRDYVEEVSDQRITLTGPRISSAGGTWKRVDPETLADLPNTIGSLVPVEPVPDAVVAFIADPPGGERYTAGTLPDGTPFLAIRCGDGRFGELGPIARWYVETLIGPHRGPEAGRACLLTGGWQGGGETGSKQPFHPCGVCKHRAGWLRLVETPAAVLRPAALYAEARLEPDGTALTLNRTALGFDAHVPDAGPRTWALVRDADYPRFDSLRARIARLCRRNDAFAEMEVGTSVGGRPVLAITVAAPGPLEPHERPAMLVTAALHGNEASVVPSVLRFLEDMDANRTAPMHHTLYVMPCVSPDAYDAFLSTPNTTWRPRANMRPYDDDRDGKTDEDGYRDLNGDGQIGYMRRKRDDGSWELIGREGVDDDGDGKIAEDIPGGVDLNRNFREGWRPGRGPFKLSRGDAPLSEPESQAVAEVLARHPNIALVVDVHNDADTLFVRMGERADRRTPLTDHRDYASYAPVIDAARRVFGYEPQRMGRGGMWAAHAYETAGVPGTILEIGAGVGERAPATRDAEAANAWSQKHFGIDGWQAWQPFDHPQLGPIEIGGDWKTLVKRSPPPGRPLGTVATRVAHFLATCAARLPRVAVAIDTATEGEMAVVVQNTGGAPSATKRLAEVAPGRARHVLSIRPGSPVTEVPDALAILSSNADEVRIAIPPLAPGASWRIGVDRGTLEGPVTAAIEAGTWAGAPRATWTPSAADAGEIVQVDMPAHESHYVLHVPATVRADSAAALLVDLHGAAPVASNPAKISVRPWKALAARHGMLHLLPQSRGRAWLRADDDRFILDCIEHVAKTCAIDRSRIWLTGFSAGADYSLHLLAKHPKVFAAAAPFMPGQFLYGRRGGRGLTAEGLAPLKGFPILYVTGTADVRRPTVREIVFTLRTLGLPCELRTVPGVGHVFPPQREYVRVLDFLKGQRPAGDVVPELAFPRLPVGEGHVAVAKPSGPSKGVLVVLPARGLPETRPELRAYEPAMHVHASLGMTVLLPVRASGIDAAFVAACCTAAGVEGPVFVYAHGSAAARVPALLAHDAVAGAIVSGPRADFLRALDTTKVTKPVRVLLGAIATDRERMVGAFDAHRSDGAPLTARVLEGTRLTYPPAASVIAAEVKALQGAR